MILKETSQHTFKIAVNTKCAKNMRTNERCFVDSSGVVNLTLLAEDFISNVKMELSAQEEQKVFELTHEWYSNWSGKHKYNE